MEGTPLAILGGVWLLLGAITFVAAWRARRNSRARLVGRITLGVLFLLAGALVNAVFLATGVDYAGFADGSASSFVTDTWRSVVAPNQTTWIGLLVAFEAAVGILVVLGGRATQLALVAMMVFHVALLAFGWGFALWSVPMLIALSLLLRAELEAAHREEERLHLARARSG